MGSRPAPRLAAFVVAFACMAAASFAFWGWMGRPVPLPDVPGARLQCMSYTPFEGGLSPLDKDYDVSPATVDRDLRVLKDHTDCVRTYSSMRTQGYVPAAAAKLGMKVLAGIWISGTKESDDKEIAAAVAAAKANPEAIRAIVVGNEVMLRREMSGDRLAGIIRSVKAQTNLPVTYADIFEFWRRNPQLADAVDFVTIHILPHWDDPEPVSIDEVQSHVRGIVDKARALFPHKRLTIGEIGWPSAGRTRGAAAPTLVNEARFIREFVRQADSIGVGYNIIEAIDQPWKKWPEGTVGGYWGLLDKDLKPKFPLAGPVTEWPQWRAAFGFSTAASLLLLGFGLVGGWILSWGRWLVLAALGQAAGGGLAIAADHIRVTALGLWDWALGIGGLGLIVAAALLALPLIRASGSPWTRAVPAPLSEVVACLRRPSRLACTPAMAMGILTSLMLVAGAAIALIIAVDGRHRDFPIPIFWLPALVLAARHWLGPEEGPGADHREEGWMAIVLVVAGFGGLDGLRNVEAMAWCATCLVLAAPWLSAARHELARLKAALL
ncbi:MAG: hypothetical protein H7841_05700 [Magnetospirillum sp. WYHS-4]